MPSERTILTSGIRVSLALIDQTSAPESWDMSYLLNTILSPNYNLQICVNISVTLAHLLKNHRIYLSSR